VTINLSIKKKLLIYSFFIQLIVLAIFSYSLYKSLGVSTLDKFQSTLKVIILDVTDDLIGKENITDTALDEGKEYHFDPLFIRFLDAKTHEKIIQTSNFPDNLKLNDVYYYLSRTKSLSN